VETPPSLEFFFDPICPWAYQASLWVREVRQLTGVQVTWRFFSLEEINREPGKKHPWERPWSYGWSLMRIGALLRRDDPELLDRWYLGLGRAFYEEARPVFLREEAEDLADELGLGREIVERALDDVSTHDDVRDDHLFAVEELGAFGVPTLSFAGRGPVFGPVVTPAPTGKDALRLFDLVCSWSELPNLYEIRRPKRAADLEHIARSFEPYLSARRWRTVQNPVA
jgi:predicted DsbA family dithiol-disulfide isomerase